MQSAVPSRHPKYRTKLCRNLSSGDCPFGQKCSFFHPAKSIDPPSSLLAQQPFQWNPLLLPQLLALSNAQAAQKMMPRRSPPRSQGPQLIDEDPSPPSSLLLSRSDCTSSEQVPQARRFNKRKRYPCRHFIRTGGWCPAASQCKFLRDVTTFPPAGVRKTERTPPSATDEPGEGRTISGGVLIGIQSPSPPIVRQSHPEPPRYTEAELMQQYQAMYWPNYTLQPYQPHYTSGPATVVVPIPVTPPPLPAMQQSLYPPPQSEAQTAPPNETQMSLPLGSYEMNGTTYFPTCVPCDRAPSPVPYSMPVHPPPYNPIVAPTYPHYAPPGMPAGYYDVANPTTDAGQQNSFDPFASDPMMPHELPVIPRLEDYQMSPTQQDVLALLQSSASVANGNLGLTTTTTTTVGEPPEEFPYHPPKDQRVGHARRISVNIKKHARANSG